jgi:hypothetical protein
MGVGQPSLHQHSGSVSTCCLARWVVAAFAGLADASQNSSAIIVYRTTPDRKLLTEIVVCATPVARRHTLDARTQFVIHRPSLFAVVNADGHPSACIILCCNTSSTRAYASPIMGSHMTVNGLKLWVQDSGPETATKGTVLLFHGFPDTSDM